MSNSVNQSIKYSFIDNPPDTNASGFYRRVVNLFEFIGVALGSGLSEGFDCIAIVTTSFIMITSIET